MLKIIPVQDDVIAMSFEGRITAEEVDQSYDLIEEKLKSGEQISAYFELRDELKVETDAIKRDLTRAHEILGKLKQFERVAFVSNVSWIRGIAKLEDLLFGRDDLEMQVYDESEADHAFAWVKGETQDRHGLSLQELKTDDPNVVAFELCGKMRKDDLDVARQIMSKFVDDNPPRCLMAKFTKFQGFEMALMADREMIKAKRQAMDHLDRYAMVGAPDWIENIAETLSGLFRFEMRTFDLDEEDEAMDWLKESVTA
ncbi:STAS/SEC14 domain-containing protein [Parasphingorhabdus sp.]|uniref:STAS/SEC14 domain-containing protein n=1 Tax=Parasphingorhabdus sp. TaxID=2709688 RepID=UPI003263E57C